MVWGRCDEVPPTTRKVLSESPQPSDHGDKNPTAPNRARGVNLVVLVSTRRVVPLSLRTPGAASDEMHGERLTPGRPNPSLGQAEGGWDAQIRVVSPPGYARVHHKIGTRV